MLSVYLIDRMCRAGRYDHLLRRLNNNGLALTLPLMIRLTQSPTSAIALGLWRVTELSYGATNLSRQMTHRLLVQQQPDGSFDGDPLPTAVATAALAKGLQASTAQPDAAAACRQALAALAAMQDDDGLFRYGADRSDQQRAAVAAFICWQLADDDDFRKAVRFCDMMNWFESRHRRLEASIRRMWRMARAGAPCAEAAAEPGLEPQCAAA